MKLKKLTGVLFCMLSINNAHALLFDAVSDEMVHNRSNGSPAGSDNSSNSLAVVGTTNYNLHSFIKFDISSFTNAGIDAASVSLNLFTSSNRPNSLTNRFRVFGLNQGISQTWSESTKGDTLFDGTNFPGLNNDTTLSPVESDTTLLHGAGDPPFTWGMREWLEISNSSFVDFINNDSDGILTFILTKPENTGQIDFLSRTSDGSAGDFAPQLNIQAVPVPAAVWLFGSALIGLVSLRRKV